jgi:hypothetical protein
MTVEDQFYQHLTQHAEEWGFTAPQNLIIYLGILLSSRLRDTEIIPKPSFAERYLQLYHCTRPHEIKDFGDSCLLFCSLLPKYGESRGLSMEYYATLGISAYYTWGDLAQDDRGIQLGNWFYYCQKFLDSALHSDRPLSLTNIMDMK